MKETLTNFLELKKEITKNKFELSQPLLIEQIYNVLGLGPNEYNVETNTKVTPVDKPLLNSFTPTGTDMRPTF